MRDKYYGIRAILKPHTNAPLSSRSLDEETSQILKEQLKQILRAEVDEAAALAYLNTRPESKEMSDLVRQIEASRKRSQKTQKEIIKLRKRNQALLAKL